MVSVSRRKITWTNVGFKYIQLTVTVISGLVLVPLYLSYLTVDQYGAWLTVGSVVIWLAAFDPGLANLLTQRVGYASGTGDIRSVRGYAYAGMICGGLAATLVVVMGQVIAPLAVQWMGFEGQSATLMIWAFRVAVWTTGLMVFGYSLTGVSLGLHQSLGVGLLFLGAAVLKIIVVLVLLAQGVGLMSLPYADLASALWVVVVGAGLLWRGLGQYGYSEGRIGMERLSELVGLFAFSLGARLGKVISRNLDNVFIARALGPEAVVTYSLTATAPRQSENLISLPVVAFRPALAHLAGSGDAIALRFHLSRLLHYIFWGLGLLFAGLAAFNDDFVRLWVGVTHFSGMDVALGLCLVFFLHVWSNSLGILGFSLGDIQRNSIIEWISSLLLIPAVFIGATYGDLLGVVLAHTIVMSVTTVWYFPWSLYRRAGFNRQELHDLTVGLGQALISTLSIALLFSLANPNKWGSFAGFVLALVASYFLMLYMLSRRLREEVVRVWGWGLARLR